MYISLSRARMVWGEAWEQLAASWPAEEFPAAARAGLEDGALDQPALERVARARRLDIAPA